MRKNTARKWVHLLLDLLPVLIIPIFAIYLINHNPQGLQVETGGSEIQLKYETNEVNSIDDLIEGNIYHIECEVSDLIGNVNSYLYFNEFYNDNNIVLSAYSSSNLSVPRLYFTNTESFDFCAYFMPVSSEQFAYGYYLSKVSMDVVFQSYTGNLPYYVFSESQVSIYELVDNATIIYDNTDIGSQFVYSLYIPVHDYFNMTNLFNFGDIYTWINNSMFSGNAPLPIFIVYNVIVYEFLIDLIFLIYSIFMFIIDFTSELLARCFSFSNKGGTR